MTILYTTDGATVNVSPYQEKTDDIATIASATDLPTSITRIDLLIAALQDAGIIA